jgi:hypothetical protein
MGEDKPKRTVPFLIWITQKTEMDKRLERLREYLLTTEQLTPEVNKEYAELMSKLTKPKDTDEVQ